MKIGRRDKIKEIISTYDIETQQELVEKLRESDYNVTQATVSRDIRTLRLMKETGPSGHQRYRLPSVPDTHEGRFMQVFRNAFVSIESAGNIVVIRTHTGMASALCIVLDQQKMPEILGSVAGDDTIIIAARSDKDAVSAKEKLEKMLE